MATIDGSPSFVHSVDPTPEYYEEVDDHTLDFRKRKAFAPIKSIREPTKLVDPIKQLNEQLNRQFRPDLAVPTPSPPPISSELPAIQPVVKKTLPPNPVIYDARAKPVKSPKQKKKPTISVKQKLLNRIHQLTAPTTESPSYTSELFQQQTPTDSYQIPPDMALVYVPQKQQNSMLSTASQQPQSYPMIPQYKTPTVPYNNGFKNNKVAPPPIYDKQTVNQILPYNSYQTPSVISTNPLIQSTQEKVLKPTDQSKKRFIANPTDTNRSFALYNQKNGRIEGVVKNRLNVAADNTGESRIVDEETEPKGKWALWLSQPLCLGLKRLNGGLLFGTMILLGIASFAGFIASIATYSEDSSTNAQWKILGMVVCAIMLITIIVTLIVFICCYKYGYMFNQDADMDRNDPSTIKDAEGNEQQKAVLRKIYKFNRPNDTSSVLSGMMQDVSPLPLATVRINDKQTNTEATIAPLRPIDFDRGVWPSINAYNGISYRPLIPPPKVSRFIQVLPHEIDETFQSPQIIYQFVAPATVVPSPQVQPRIIQLPAQRAPVVEVIEPKQSQTTLVRQPQTQQIVVQPTTRIEYVDVEEQRPRRIIQKPQYEIVEEVIEGSASSTSEEYVEIVDAPKHRRKHARKKEKKQGFSKVSVKHVKSTGEEPSINVKEYNRNHFHA